MSYENPGITTGFYDIAIGDFNTIKQGMYVQAMGNNNVLDGSNERLGNRYVVAMGSDNGYSNTYTKQTRAVSGRYLNLVGFGNSAVGTEINVIGTDNGLSDRKKTRSIKGIDLNIIGSRNSVNANNTSLLGSDIVATQSNSVILGDNSTDRAATIVKDATVNGIKYDKFAGVATTDKMVILKMALLV